MTRTIIRICQLVIMLLYRIPFRIFRKAVFINDLSTPLGRSGPVLYISNHQKHFDPPAIYSTVSLPFLFDTAPIRFLTWWKYYWSPLWPILYVTGGFPTHGPGHTGIKGMAYFAQHGFRTFIFPEGKTEHRRTPESKPYKGVSKLIELLPEARIVLLRIDWEGRSWRRMRPRVMVRVSDAPADLDTSNPEQIMKAIYEIESIL